MYQVTMNGRPLIGQKDFYELNEIVKIYLLTPSDTTINIFIKDIDYKKEYSADGLYCIFTMPNHDVDIEISYENDMQKKANPTYGVFSNFISMVNPSFLGKKENTSFCQECGAPIIKGEAYCPICKERLKK